MKHFLFILTILGACLALASMAAIAQDNAYVGDGGCMECHEEVCLSFTKMSPKKAHPSEGFPKLLSDFTSEQRTYCYTCHVIGAGAPGGFLSFEQTPELGHVGCETCHGPGKNHVEDEDPESIVASPGETACAKCHDGKRVPAITLYGRPHGLDN